VDTREELLVFVSSRTAPAPVPFVPELWLHQATEVTPLWHATAARLRGWDDSPYWAFPWAGGQALARLLLDRPELVRGRSVVDFASGSGLCAIAAARAGARRVLALDRDPMSGAAVALNAARNRATVRFRGGDPIGEPLPGVEVLLAGDVFYERELASRSVAWFEELAALGVTVLAGDGGRAYAPVRGFEVEAEYEVPTTLAIEDAPLRRARVLRLG
jgi:predicted nicotinamide N-methyase